MAWFLNVPIGPLTTHAIWPLCSHFWELIIVVNKRIEIICERSFCEGQGIEKAIIESHIWLKFFERAHWKSFVRGRWWVKLFWGQALNSLVDETFWMVYLWVKLFERAHWIDPSGRAFWIVEIERKFCKEEVISFF